MTDVIGSISQMVSDWNGNEELEIESKCGLCWEFTAPIRESDLNEYIKRSDECCVIVAVTDYRYSVQQTVNRNSGMITNKAEVFNFNLHFLAFDDLGLNVYNEIPNHPLNESKWATILKPLADCAVTDLLTFCEYIGRELEVVTWIASPRIDWQDMNYTGWSVQVQLRNNNLV